MGIGDLRKRIDEINMREIKFRAFRKNHKDYETGWAVPNQVFEFSDANGFTEFGFDIPEDIVVMQFTGLLDKNGKEIYEGDIIDYEDEGGIDENGRQTIGWDNEGAAFGRKYLLENALEDEFSSICFSEVVTKSEVIGNIYENAELLK